MDVELILKRLGIKNIELYEQAKEVRILVDKSSKEIFTKAVNDLEINSAIVYLVGWNYGKITQKRIFNITGVNRIKIKNMMWKIYNCLPKGYKFISNYNPEEYDMDLTQFKKNYSKVCPVCNKKFITGLPQSKYCSKECVKKKGLQLSRIKNIGVLIKSTHNKFKNLYEVDPKEAEKLLVQFENIVNR